MTPAQGLGISDCDFVAHRFMVHGSRVVQFMLHVEVKTWLAELRPSQRDTLAIDHQLIRTHNSSERSADGRLIGNGGGTKPRRVWSPMHKQHVWLNFLGWNLLQMSGDTPDDSIVMLWNGKTVKREQVIALLQMDIHPRSFRKLDARRHKAGHKTRSLFGDY